MGRASNGCLLPCCAHRCATSRSSRITFFVVFHEHFFSTLFAALTCHRLPAAAPSSNTFFARMSLACAELPYYHRVFLYVLGSCLSAGETNSSWPGYYLW